MTLPRSGEPRGAHYHLGMKDIPGVPRLNIRWFGGSPACCSSLLAAFIHQGFGGEAGRVYIRGYPVLFPLASHAASYPASYPIPCRCRGDGFARMLDWVLLSDTWRAGVRSRVDSSGWFDVVVGSGDFQSPSGDRHGLALALGPASRREGALPHPQCAAGEAR